MSKSYDDNDVHSSAVRQIADARRDAVEAIEKARLANRKPARHPNLTPADASADLSIANQRLATYLLHLRPYSDDSDRWETDLGVIKFEQDITVVTSGEWGDSVRGRETPDRTLYRLNDLNDVIEAINSPLRYVRTGTGSDVEHYRVVLTSSQLITVFELADEIATEMGFLADVSTPDFNSDGQGAV